MALLKIDGTTARKVAQADLGDFGEGIAFSPDRRELYMGNFVDGISTSCGSTVIRLRRWLLANRNIEKHFTGQRGASFARVAH